MRYIRKKESKSTDNEMLIGAEYFNSNAILNNMNPISPSIPHQQFPITGCYSPQPSVEQVMRQFNNVLNNPWNPDRYKLVYETKNCELFLHIYQARKHGNM